MFNYIKNLFKKKPKYKYQGYAPYVSKDDTVDMNYIPQLVVDNIRNETHYYNHHSSYDSGGSSYSSSDSGSSGGGD